MTTEQAIIHMEIRRNQLKSSVEVKDLEEDIKAFDMAIKALEQEPCEDCIPRNTVLTLINDVKQADGFREYSQYSYLFDQVDNMPSVKPISNLDKIKAEIEQVEINGYIRDVECFRAGLNTAVKIIDKYKESEVKNESSNTL